MRTTSRLSLVSSRSQSIFSNIRFEAGYSVVKSRWHWPCRLGYLHAKLARSYLRSDAGTVLFNDIRASGIFKMNDQQPSRGQLLEELADFAAMYSRLGGT